MPMQLIILSFSSNIIIMKYKWWWRLNYKEYTKIIIRFKVSEWFIPQYANQSSSLNSSAFDNESEQSTLNYFWKRDNFPYKPDRIYSTTLSTDTFSAITGASLESSSQISSGSTAEAIWLFGSMGGCYDESRVLFYS